MDELTLGGWYWRLVVSLAAIPLLLAVPPHAYPVYEKVMASVFALFALMSVYWIGRHHGRAERLS